MKSDMSRYHLIILEYVEILVCFHGYMEITETFKNCQIFFNIWAKVIQLMSNLSELIEELVLEIYICKFNFVSMATIKMCEKS
jgi:hypothetical protein